MYLWLRTTFVKKGKLAKKSRKYSKQIKQKTPTRATKQRLVQIPPLISVSLNELLLKKKKNL